MGKPCVTGAGNIKINVHEKTATIGDYKIVQGDTITIDGGSGKVWWAKSRWWSPKCRGT
jgi:pyruvate,orthophosphate dikinase